MLDFLLLIIVLIVSVALVISGAIFFFWLLVVCGAIWLVLTIPFLIWAPIAIVIWLIACWIEERKNKKDRF